MTQLRSVTCHMGSHSVTCHQTQVYNPALTPAIQDGTRFTYPGGMEGWVDLVDLIAPRPGVEPATFRSRVRRSTAAPPRQPSTAPLDIRLSKTRKKSRYLFVFGFFLFICSPSPTPLLDWHDSSSDKLYTLLASARTGWTKKHCIGQSLTPHPTQYRSFRRRSLQPITWLLLTNQKGKHVYYCNNFVYCQIAGPILLRDKLLIIR